MATHPGAIAEKVRELIDLLRDWHDVDVYSDVVAGKFRAHCSHWEDSGPEWSGPDRDTRAEAEQDAKNHLREVGALQLSESA